MHYEMKLFVDWAFDMIESGKKTVELRLNDKKRSQIKIGDKITFISKDDKKNLTRVVGLCNFANFDDMFKIINPELGGFSKTDNAKYCAEWMNSIYLKEDIEKYGTLGIVIEKI